MLPSSIHKALIVLSVTVALTGCLAKQYVVHPPAPTLLPPIPNPLSPATESTVSFPVQMNLAPFLATVNDENVIPKAFDQSGNPVTHSKGNDHKYFIERDDFTIERLDFYQSMGADQGTVLRNSWKGIDLPGTRLPLTADLRHHFNAHAQSPVRKMPVDCSNGDRHERAKRTVLNGSIAIGMTPSYGLSGSVAEVSIDTINECNFRVATSGLPQEVKNRLTDTVRGELNQAVTRLNAATVRSHVEEVWNGLRTPIQLEPNSWLLLNVDKVKHSGFSIGGQSLNDTLHVIAKPVIVFGPEPPAVSTELPQLDTQPASPGFHVVADIPLDYPSLSQSLAARLRGKSVAVKGDFIQIVDAAILGRGGNQVVLRITFEGDAIGHLYFVGKPEMNTLTQSIQIGGLRLDVDSEQLLAKSGPDWLARSTIRELVMGEAVLGVTPASGRMRDLVTKAMNRQVSPTITTHGTVTSVQGIGVFADVNALYVRLMSDGTLGVAVAGKP